LKRGSRYDAPDRRYSLRTGMVKEVNMIKRIALKNESLSLAMIFLLGIVFSVANPAFFSVINLLDLLRMCVKPAIFACGVMIVLISGGIDMSFLWIGMFSAYTTSKLFSILQANGTVVPLAVIILVSMSIGAVLGSFNTLLVSKFRIPVFIATLSSANIFMGIMFQFVGSEYIFPEQMPRAMIEFSNKLLFSFPSQGGTMVGLHASVLFAVAVMIVTHLVMRYTMTGRSVYALGGDASSAERVGFSLTRVNLFVFVAAGMIAGLAGAIAICNIQVANPYDFQGQELTVTAAVIIGGTRVTGGKGSVLGVALGVLLTNLISQNLILVGVPPEYNKFVFGLLIIFATIVQAFQERARKAFGRG
jgi:simple sugar transport system permease protein